MQHQPYASSAVGSSDALLRATAGSSGLSRRAVLRFGALFSAGLALSACSGQPFAGSSASASASSADARRVFRFAQGAAPLGLDPALFPVASTYQVTAQVLQTLLVANHYTGDPEVQDSLCSEWTVSDDRLVHTFVLREAHFSNGSALSADAVVQNFQRWQALATGEGRCLRGVLVCRSRVLSILRRWSLRLFRRLRRVRLLRLSLQVLPRLLLRALLMLRIQMRRRVRSTLLRHIRCSLSCRWFRRWWRRVTPWW